MITPQPAPLGCVAYTPGAPVFGALGNLCVEAGDRIIITSVSFVNPVGANVDADADGFFPHLVYRPQYVHLKDIDESIFGDYSAGGNDTNPPTFRVDFGELVCRWPGTVTVEGGAGVGGAAGSLGSPILVTYVWDRSRRGRAGWVKGLRALLRALATGNDAPLPLPSMSVNAASAITHNTLTMYNSRAGTRVTRPMGAVSVWTPNAQNIVLDNGAGTIAATTVSSFGQPTPLGSFQALAPSVGGTLIFGVHL